MTYRVFISRRREDCEQLSTRLESENYHVFAQSLIVTEPIPFDKKIPPCDWIFFSSSNAVRHFFEQKPELANQRMAAIGRGTADTLSFYHHPDFVGDAMDIEDTAYRFAEQIEGQKVLFPIAEDSLRHVQAAFEPGQIIEVPVYKTRQKDAVVPSCDAYVFSSPSNVRAFFHLQPEVNPRATWIAFGHATADALRQHGVIRILIPPTLSAEDIFNTINQSLRG